MSVLDIMPSPPPSRAVVSSYSGPRIDAFGLSHPGRWRRTNEDSFAVLHHLGLFMVADGMGGAAAGEVASRMAVNAVRAVFQDPDLTWPHGLPDRPPHVSLPLLKAGIEYANERIHAAAVESKAHAGMGTTIAALLALGEDRVALAHVGDSRIYGLRGRRFEQLTVDHSLVNALCQTGAMTRETADKSELRHVLSRAVGTQAAVEVDARLVAAQPGDTFLLATDGLHGVVADETMAAILLREHDLTAAATRLVDCANELGGPDNISVVVVRMVGAAR
jgi:protein phosphatase